jgi:hypothetical protein
MHRPTEPVRVAGWTEPVTVAGPNTGRAVLRLAWIVVALIGVAVLKPWGEAPSSPPAARPATGPTPEVSQTSRPRNEMDLVSSFCLEPSGWRVYSAEHWAGQRVRSWTAVTPVSSATGPTDPRIPIIPVVSQAVLAIGFCSPVHGPEAPPSTATDHIYRLRTVTIDGERLLRADAVAPVRIAPVERASYLGAVYGPLSGSSWADGVYIVRIEGSGYTRWFGIQVEILNPTAGR